MHGRAPWETRSSLFDVVWCILTQFVEEGRAIKGGESEMSDLVRGMRVRRNYLIATSELEAKWNDDVKY
jgi:hypothetical protein